MDITQIIEGVEIADVLITTLAGSAVVSETLPFVKKWKSNSTFQLCFNVLKSFVNAIIIKRQK